MFAILSSIPIFVAIFLMVGLRKKSGVSLAVAWGCAVILAMIFWGMDLSRAGALTAFGFLSALNVIIVVWCAIFLLNAMMKMKFVETIGNGFSGITNDRRIQLIIIAYLFGAFIESVAGFGTPGALAAPLLVGLGVPVFFAALASIMANYSPVLFGGVGTPITQGFATISPALEASYGAEFTESVFRQLNLMTAFTNIFVGALVPFLIIAAIVCRDGKKRGLRDAFNILPLCLFCGLLFTVPVWLIVLLTGSAEIPTLLSSLIALPVFIFAVKKGFLVPKEVYRFQDDPITLPVKKTDSDISLFAAWSPYIIIAALLAITRIPALPFARMISGADAVGVIAIQQFLGLELNFSLPLLNNPGVFPFLPVTIIFLIMRKVSGNDICAIFVKTNNQLKNAIVALLFGVALVQIMRFTSPAGATPLPMTTAIAQSMTDIFGAAFPLVNPLIGALGAFVSGSHTVSNIMFYGLQLETSGMLGLPAVLILVGQTSGASIGNMIAIHNAVAISATTGAIGKEGKIISAAFVPFLICCLLMSLILFIYLAVGFSWVL
jgi:lactate permease